MNALSTTSSLLPPAFLVGTAAGFVGYGISWLAFKLALSAFATGAFKAKLASLDERAMVNFISLGPSTVHAIAQCLGTYPTVLLSGPHRSDPALYFDDRLFVDGGGARPGPAFHSGVFVGYLLADFLVVGPRYLGGVFAVHHLSAAATWTLCSATRTMQWLTSFLQFNELSTVWVNARQILLTAGYPSSGGHVTAASLALFLTFGAVRVAPLPWIVRGWMTRDFYEVRDAAGIGAAVALTLSLVIHVSMQGYWFGLMTKKFLGAIFGGKGGKEPKQKKN